MNKYMQLAINEANKTATDIPVGAVIVKKGKIIAKAHNTKELDNKITSHAEILAIHKASELLNNWRLDDCEIYVTLEPCPMCAWAILESRIKAVYFGSFDNNYGALVSKLKLNELSNSNINIYGGILEKECDMLINEFFNKLRHNIS